MAHEPDSEPSTAGAERVRAAVERTLQAGTARIRQTMHSPDGPVVATGTVDFVHRRATAVMTLPPHPDPRFPGTPSDVTMIIDGADTYTQVIDLPGRWIHDRLATAGASVSAGDPGMLLDLLRGALRAAPVGDAELSAQRLVAFDVEVDLDRAIERAPDDLRRSMREALDALLRDRAPHRTRVHLDDHGHIRYVDATFLVTDGQPTDRLEVELFDLGADVAVELPDAASILDQDEMTALGAELSERFGDELLTPPAGWDDADPSP